MLLEMKIWRDTASISVQLGGLPKPFQGLSEDHCPNPKCPASWHNTEEGHPHVHPMFRMKTLALIDDDEIWEQSVSKSLFLFASCVLLFAVSINALESSLRLAESDWRESFGVPTLNQAGITRLGSRLRVNDMTLK